MIIVYVNYFFRTKINLARQLDWPARMRTGGASTRAHSAGAPAYAIAGAFQKARQLSGFQFGMRPQSPSLALSA